MNAIKPRKRHCLADSYLSPSLLAVRRPQYPIPTTPIAANVLAIGQLQSEALRPIKLAKQRSLIYYLPILAFW